MRYSRGDSAADVTKDFSQLLVAWENAERLHLELMSDEEYRFKFDWSVNLDHYIVCFWITGLAFFAETNVDEWARLISLMGNEGKDKLLDELLAAKQPNRSIGEMLCHPRPYQKLLNVVEGSVGQRSAALNEFVESWYTDLNRVPKNRHLSGDSALYERPYWYKYGEKNMAGGAYFGQWCIEAALVAKMLAIDDSFCLGHPQYPGDLLRPGVVTQADMQRLPSSLKKWHSTAMVSTEETQTIDSIEEKSNLRRQGWISRLFSKS